MMKLIRNSLFSICLLLLTLPGFAAPECDYNEAPGYSHCTYLFDRSGYDLPSHMRTYLTLPDGTQTAPYEFCAFEAEFMFKTSAPAGTYTRHIEMGKAIVDGVVQYVPYASQTFEHFGTGRANPEDFMVGRDARNYPTCDKTTESSLLDSEFFEVRTR